MPVERYDEIGSVTNRSEGLRTLSLSIPHRRRASASASSPSLTQGHPGSSDGNREEDMHVGCS